MVRLLHQIERHHTVIVAVDTGRLMASQIDGLSKLDHALNATVGLIRASSRAQDRIGFGRTAGRSTISSFRLGRASRRMCSAKRSWDSSGTTTP